jgi:hypothetical protein
MRVVNLSAAAPSRRITALSYGAPRAGKTRFAATFPKPLFLSDATESGWTTITAMNRDDWYDPEFTPVVWAVEDSKDMPAALDQLDSELKQNPRKYETLVIDSITFYTDLYFNTMFRAAAQGGRMPDTRNLYMLLQAHLRELRIRVHSLPLNVVWLALEKAPGEDQPFGLPLIAGQSATKLMAGCDYVFFHRVFQNTAQEGPRWEVRTKQYGQYRAGGRDEGLLPDPLPECTYRSLAEALGIKPEDKPEPRRTVVTPANARAQAPAR